MALDAYDKQRQQQSTYTQLDVLNPVVKQYLNQNIPYLNSLICESQKLSK